MITNFFKNITDKLNKKNYIAPGKGTRINIKDLMNQVGELKIDMQTFYDIYRSNADIRGAIREISKSVGKNGLYLQDKNGEVIEDKSQTEIFSLFEAPILYNFILNCFKHSFISGELYLAPEYQMGTNKVIGIKFLDPRSMQKFINKDTGNIMMFKQVIPGKDPIPFTRDELAYYQFEEDPNNTYTGLSLLEGIIWEALSDEEASKRNFYFFKNNGVPNAIFMLDGEGYTEEEIGIASDKIKADLTGSENAHKFIISNGIKDVKTIALTNKDIEFINLRKLTTEKVCALFGVPKNILGYVEDVNYSNGNNMSENYIENTIIPNAKYLEYIINSFYNKFVDKTLFSKGITIKLDSESVDKRELIEKGQREDVKLGIITINEIRKERGLDEFLTEEAKNPIISNNFVLLEDITITPVINTNNQ